jgi:hypothetical protein
MRRLFAAFVALALLCELAGAQNRVRTETIVPQALPPGSPKAAPQVQTPTPAAPQAPAPTQAAPATPQPAPPTQSAPATPTRPAQGPPSALTRAQTAPSEIITDLSRLPLPVARTRARILEAARSGELEKLAALMQSGEIMPIFTFGDEKNPLIYWRANYPDSGGVEVLAILINILEAGFVRIDEGTPQEKYVWPYFAFTPLKSLTPQQKVALFRIVTGADYKEMNEFGAYIFYRLGIAPDGTWHFFVSGD